MSQHDPDGRLVEGLRGRDAAAVEQLVRAYGGRAYRLASRMTGNSHDAEEVVQDALWTVVAKIDGFRGEAAFGSWLYRIVANAAYAKLRHELSRRHDVSLDAVLPVFDEQGRHGETIADWSSSVEDPSLRTELRIVLTAAIDELPEAYRAAVVLRDVDGLTNHEIARLLGVSVAAVKAHVHRARLRLRKRLAAYVETLEPAGVLASIG
jgi:RNA polymerase sigma-70 factor (ECF subfamily)